MASFSKKVRKKSPKAKKFIESMRERENKETDEGRAGAKVGDKKNIPPQMDLS